MSESSQKPDSGTLQEAIAKFRSQLAQHESVVAEGFQALRGELDALAEQFGQLVDAAKENLADISTTEVAAADAQKVPPRPAAAEETPIVKAVSAGPVSDAAAIPVGTPVAAVELAKRSR